MSTRAIVGIPNADGSIRAAWQWNDGGDILPLLNKHFNTLGKAETLITQKVWSSMMTDEELADFKDFVAKLKYEQNHIYTPVCGVHLVKRPHHIEEPNGGKYRNLADALAQDLNFVYLFNAETGKWKRYS